MDSDKVIDQVFNSTTQAMENDNDLVTGLDFDNSNMMDIVTTQNAMEKDDEMEIELNEENGNRMENWTTTYLAEDYEDDFGNGQTKGKCTTTDGTTENYNVKKKERHYESGNIIETETIHLAKDLEDDVMEVDMIDNSRINKKFTFDRANSSHIIQDTESNDINTEICVIDDSRVDAKNERGPSKNNTNNDYRKGNKARIHLSRRVKKYRGCVKRKSKINNNSTSETFFQMVSENDVVVNCEKGTEKKKNNSTQTNTKPNEIQLEGKRIVDIQYFIEALKEMGEHNQTMGCTFSNMIIKNEISKGLESEIFFECNMCGRSFSVLTNGSANQESIAGIMSIGSGYSHLAQMTSALNMPCMSENTYQKLQDKVCSSWESAAIESMIEAGKEERQLAIERGDIAEDGTPYITVVCDGSWAKRSYKRNYNSLSGAAAIVGYHTRKVLHLGVKNKFCQFCKMHEKNDTIPDHVCYKNFCGSSTSMESAIIAEGFSKSISTHGIIYKYMIADGDSSVFKTISELKPYAKHSIKVEKIECKNHLLRNYRSKIKDLLESTKLPLGVRKKVKGYHMKFSGAINKAIEYRKKEENSTLSEKIQGLRNDILNSASHILGEHKNCQKIKYFCSKPFNTSDDTLMSDLKLTSVYENLINIVSNMSRNAPSLIHNVNNNMVEQFNAIIAKYIGGKRINYCTKRSYQARCSAAAVSFNTKRPLYHITKKLSQKSPGNYCKKWEVSQKRKVIKQNLRKKNIKRKLFSGPDKNYGDNCAKPDMSSEEYEIAKETFVNLNLKKTVEEINSIEKRTRGQTVSDLWHLERRKRITASRFYEVCTKKVNTSRKKLVTSIVDPKPIRSKAIQHGKLFETTAREVLEKDLGVHVENCGLFIDQEDQYLAATPDGVIDEDTIIEIKCPYSAREMTPEEGIQNKKITFWKTDLTVNKNHKWYFQVQGQLHVTKRKYCILAVWTPKGLKHHKIEVDVEFYEKKMKEQLKDFYFNHLLLELVDSRLERNLEVRDF